MRIKFCLFAEAISDAVAGEGDSSQGGILLGYLKKTGGDMTGMLRANYGFEAGMGNVRLLETYREIAEDGATPLYGLQVYGDIRIGGSNLYIGGKQLLRYTLADGVAYLENHLSVTASCGGDMSGSVCWVNLMVDLFFGFTTLGVT